MTGMRILVCGGRDWNDRDAVVRALASVDAKKGIDVVIHGGAEGADSFAEVWAAVNGKRVVTFKADWSAYGKAAGPMRNQKMIDEGKPDGVVAFPGGKGTADMVHRAKKAGLTVWEPMA